MIKKSLGSQRRSADRRKRLGELAIGILLILQVAIYLRIWTGLFQQPVMGYVDFLSYYTAGRLVQDNSYQELYNLDLQRSIQTTLVTTNTFEGDLLPYIHPPFLTPLLALVMDENYTRSYLRWNLIILIVLGICFFVTFKVLRQHGWPGKRALLGATSGLLFYPIFISLLKGQDTAFVLLGALGWMWALRQGHERLAGLALVLTTLRPQLALMLALPLLLARRRAAWWFLGGASTLLIYSLLLIGSRGLADFLTLLSISAEGRDYGLNQESMYNFTGLALRILPAGGVAEVHIAAWILYLLALGFLCWHWWGKGHALTSQHIGLAVVLGLFCSPHLHFHDLSLLLVPILALLGARSGARRPRLMQSVLMLSGASMILLISDLSPEPWSHLVAYLLMLGLAVWLTVRLRAARQQGEVQKSP